MGAPHGAATGPLAGLSVAVTRPAGGDGLAPLLSAAGATVVEAPLIRIAAPADPTALREAAARIDAYDWVVFTSANAVAALATALPTVPAPGPRAAAVGEATAQAVRDVLGWVVVAVPASYSGSGLAAAMTAAGARPGQRVLWPRAAAAREALARDLHAAGVRLDSPEAYRTLPVPEAAAALARRVAAGDIDVVTFTSPSAVAAYAAAATGAHAACIAVIGPTTAAAVREAGLPVHVQPAEHTFTALVAALGHHFAGRAGGPPTENTG